MNSFKFMIFDRNLSIVSRHKTLNAANKKLRLIDSVKYSLHATDVNWLRDEEEALQGYNYFIGA
jgi:hypothetical protein